MYFLRFIRRAIAGFFFHVFYLPMSCFLLRKKNRYESINQAFVFFSFSPYQRMYKSTSNHLLSDTRFLSKEPRDVIMRRVGLCIPLCGGLFVYSSGCLLICTVITLSKLLFTLNASPPLKSRRSLAACTYIFSFRGVYLSLSLRLPSSFCVFFKLPLGEEYKCYLYLPSSWSTSPSDPRPKQVSPITPSIHTMIPVHYVIPATYPHTHLPITGFLHIPEFTYMCCSLGMCKASISSFFPNSCLSVGSLTLFHHIKFYDHSWLPVCLFS